MLQKCANDNPQNNNEPFPKVPPNSSLTAAKIASKGIPANRAYASETSRSTRNGCILRRVVIQIMQTTARINKAISISSIFGGQRPLISVKKVSCENRAAASPARTNKGAG